MLRNRNTALYPLFCVFQSLFKSSSCKPDCERAHSTAREAKELIAENSIEKSRGYDNVVLWDSNVVEKQLTLRIISHTKHLHRFSFSHTLVEGNDCKETIRECFSTLNLCMQPTMRRYWSRRDPRGLLSSYNPFIPVLFSHNVSFSHPLNKFLFFSERYEVVTPMLRLSNSPATVKLVTFKPRND